MEKKKVTNGNGNASQTVDGRNEFYLVEKLKCYFNVWMGSEGKLYRITDTFTIMLFGEMEFISLHVLVREL